MTRGYPSFGSSRSQLSRLRWLGVGLLAGLAAGLPASAHAQSASTWNKRGQAAELKQDYDTAYEDYLKAHDKSPKDLRYQARLDRMRFQAGAQHVDRGRVLRQNGDLAGALNEFTRALEIDPSNEAAAQEIAITKNVDRKSSSAPLPPPGGMTAIQRDLASIAGPIELKPVSDEPITFHAVEDTKNIYTAIGKLAGLNVLFDPDYTSRRIPVDLTNVSLGDALRIVGVEAGTFYKALTPDTIYIAQNNHQKHLDLDDQALQTFYLTSPSQQNDANEIYTALRQLLPTDVKSFFVPSQNAIVVRGTTDDLSLAAKILNDLDRARPEVVVDIAILEVNRDKARRLGITLPQSITITPQATPGSTTNSSSSNNNNNNNTPSDFTLNTLANMKANNFAVTNLTGATVDALLTDSDTRVLQNPSIRATDGKQATMKIGSRIPIATGSYSAGAATGITAGIGVQTQFSYADIGVNIDMTPTIHLNRDVSLAMQVEVSTHSGDVTISGVTEPIIGQRQTKQTIELKDGEPCLLAGIISQSDNATLSGTPGLAQIPFLKYFFGSNFKETAKDEVVFIVIPHVVREATLTRQNTRLIDTGTSNDVQLRRLNSPIDDLFPDSATATPTPTSPTSAATAAVAMAQQLNQQTTHQNPTAAGPATPTTPAAAVPTPGPDTVATTTGPVAKPAASNATPAAAPVSLVVVPPNSNQTVGSTFVTSIVLTNAHDLASVPVQVQYDPKILQLVNVEPGGLLGGDGQPVALVKREENGLITISASRPPGAGGVNGEGQVCLMTFKAIAAGDSKLALVKVGARTTTNGNVPAVGTQATVHVK